MKNKSQDHQSQHDWIWGWHSVQAALAERRVHEIICSKERDDARSQTILVEAQAQALPISRLTRQELDVRYPDVRHQGIVVRIQVKAALNENQLWELLDQLSVPPLLLILDGVTDPHNLGACLRSAEAAGVHAVIVPNDKSAGLNATSRKVSAGAAERVPFVQVVNLARVLEELKQRGVWLAGLAGEGAQSLYQTDLKGALAVVMGAEGAGLRRLTRELCDYLVFIPMQGAIESLNVSVATGVVLFEALRQRQ